MEGTTDPSVLEDRLYYKIGSFVYDNAKVVLVATLLLGVGLAGLITLEPKYIEGFGEGDLESVHGWDAIATGFSDENESSYEVFYVLFHHPTGNSSDVEIRAAMEETVKVLQTNEDVSIDYQSRIDFCPPYLTYFTTSVWKSCCCRFACSDWNLHRDCGCRHSYWANLYF